ncbi:hypothetical protein MTR_1g025640 [Medicago truncatula]|uniref:Uncharacterized protein n=1 Tax=Medicago truncatula TaxID=3880 RepID=G7I7S1_MEDTR|nr:hypothetical protein MTR_1g025640 [Medicago truncatula]
MKTIKQNNSFLFLLPPSPSHSPPPSSTPLFCLQPLSHPAPLTIPTGVAAILTSNLCLLCNTPATSYFPSQICASHPIVVKRRREKERRSVREREREREREGGKSGVEDDGNKDEGAADGDGGEEWDGEVNGEMDEMVKPL